VQACYVHVSFWHAVLQTLAALGIVVPLVLLVLLIAFVASYIDDKWKRRTHRG
jgi:hypothetical protein